MISAEEAFKTTLTYVQILSATAEALADAIRSIEAGDEALGLRRLKELEFALRKSHQDIMASMVPGSGARAH